MFPSIFEHPCDDVPNWSRQQAILALEGEIVSIEHIGSFRVGDHLQVIHKRLARGMPWELPIVGLLMELAARMDPDALTVDVGANVGTVTIPVAAVSTGKVLAFEPEPTNYADLCGNLNLNELSNVTARQEACSDHAGKGEMKRVLSNNPGMAQLSERESGPISVVTLDAAIDGRPVGLLKMDVEGHERKVLAGAAKTIETSRPLIVCEVLKDNAAELQAAFANLGYAGERIFRSDWLFVPRR